MTDANYWRQRYEMLMATFTDAVRAAIDAHSMPRYLADAESYNLGKMHGSIEERESCAKEADKWSKRDDDVGAFIGKAIRTRGETK